MPPTIEDIQEAYNTILTGDLFQANGAIVAGLYPDTHGKLRGIIKRSYRQFYEDSIKQSLEGNDIGSFKTLSEMNLRRVTNYADGVDPAERGKFTKAFENIRFYWKTSRSERRFPSIMATGKLLSTTSVLNQYSRTVDNYNLWLPHSLGDPQSDEEDDDLEDYAESKKLVNTNTRELHYREDGGFVFFRVEPNGTPPENTRYGSSSFIFDPRSSPLKINDYGWVSLRDVFHPYSEVDFNLQNSSPDEIVPDDFDIPERYKNIITVGNGTTPIAQRISVYSKVKKSDISTINGGKPVPQSKYKSVAKLVYAIDDNRENRRTTSHYLLYDKSELKRRDENVLESMFVGQDMAPGIMYSVLRALHELPPLWEQAIVASGNNNAFRAFIETWLHRFYHIEGKYPVAVDIPNKKVAGLSIYRAGKPYDFPSSASKKNPLNPDLGAQTSPQTGTSGVKDFPG